MNASQLVEALARAAEAAKPAQEYCLFWIDWWPMCMTKTEWASWVQAIGGLIAIAAAGWYLAKQLRHAEHFHLSIKSAADIEAVRACIEAAHDAVYAMENLALKISGDDGRPPSSSRERIEGLEATFRSLLAMPVPAVAMVPVLQILRELAYSRTAIRGSRARETSSERSKSAFQRSGKVQKALKNLTTLHSRMIELSQSGK